MTGALSPLYDPRLMEEAVFLALRQRPEMKKFQKEREIIYETGDADEREERFSELNRSWFVDLGLSRIVEQALAEQPLVASLVAACFVVRAAGARDEGVELFVAPDEGLEPRARRTVRVLLRPESLLTAEPLITLLRHEFFHIADMLDPDFAYQPALPKAEGGPTYDTLITNRYRVLWNVTISGRMTRRGWLKEPVRDQQRTDFCAAFPMLEKQAEEWFQRFFNADHPKHAELAAFALDPRAAAGHPLGQSNAATHCPLCKFPTRSFEPEPENLGNEVTAAISRDFPRWTPARGLCAQCADLYRARDLSLAAARALPGWTSSSAR